MMMRLLIWIVFLIFPSAEVSIPEYRTPLTIDPETPTVAPSPFISPVHRSISISGTFGELRPNHFHAGLDIKSANGSSGEPVYAVAKGFVARIKISAYGYGRALYIQHPNGYTSVYAHLDRFIPAIEQYIMKEHYKRQRFEMDLSISPNTFPVSQDQHIAYLGNSGSSTGPHLHFEVRNSMSEEVLNPLLYGIKPTDQIAPKMYSIKLYGQSQGNAIPMMTLPVKNLEAGGFDLEQDTLLINGDQAAIAIKAYDQSLNSSQRLGVYGIKLYADDVLTYEFEMNTLSFDEMRYSNAHRDYEEQVKRKQVYHRLFRLPGNKLPIYKQTGEDGWITLQQQEVLKVKIESYDQSGNASFLQFYIKQADGPPPSSPYGSDFIAFDKLYIKEESSMKLEIPANALYADLYLDYEANPSDNTYSQIYKIHDSTSPLHRSFTLSIKPEHFPSSLRKKATIVSVRGDSYTNQGGKWDGEWLKTKINSFGRFAIVVDTLPPSIKAVHFKTDMKKSNFMRFKISDNFGVSGEADELTYNAYIDGAWVLMQLDSKTDMITHHFDHRTAPGKHTLRLSVRDDRGNERSFVQTFIR